MARFLNNEVIDRRPIYFFHGSVGAKLAGMSYIESETSAKNIARKEIETYHLLGIDQVSVNYGLYGLAQSFHSNFSVNHFGNLTIDSYLLDKVDQIEGLDPHLITFAIDDYQQKLYAALELVMNEIGQEVDVYFELPGPLTAAASLIEPETLLRATRKQPGSVHRLLDFVTDCLTRIIEHFQTIEGVGFSLMDPVSSGDLISNKQYREFSLPYTKHLVAKIHQFHPFTTIHICGDTTKLLDAIADTGIDAISLDQKVDLSKAVERVGDRVILIGNIDPVATILQGSPETIYSDIKSGVEQMSGDNKGYIIAPGCSIPYHTSLDNIYSFMDSAKALGKF